MSGLSVKQTSRLQRARCAASGLSTTPPELRPKQLELLKDWLRSDAGERQWIKLLDVAGQERLELAEELLPLLLQAGVVQTKEKFSHGQWLVEWVRWSDVAELQRWAGLRTAEDRKANRNAINERLELLSLSAPWLESGVRHCLDTRLSESVREARLELLLALRTWVLEQRFGLWRDFAQHARGTTKSISTTEWKWLEEHVPLEKLGIARFAPMLWLGGALNLQTTQGAIAVAAAGICALPMRLFASGLSAMQAPLNYWLIENRASFERQCAQPSQNTCIVWLPGRPSVNWCEAMSYLLQIAPAAGQISCDPDPAGVEIALTAGALWQQAGLSWQAHRMQREDWEKAPAIPLSPDDFTWLDRLQSRDDLPAELQQLCVDLRDTKRKAEQEYWL